MTISLHFLFNTFLICNLIKYSIQQQSTSCINPNRKNGNCISIYECPSLIGAIQLQPLPEQNKKFLIESQCRGISGRFPHVCCTDDNNYTTSSLSLDRSTTESSISTDTSTSTSPIDRASLLPTLRECGRQSSDDKIYNGNNTALDEFSWMVLLEYIGPTGQRVLNCGGSLINRRYVLTAAHCVTGAIEKHVGKLVRVRLGEYDTTMNRDCIQDDCADPILEIDIDEIIPHDNYTDGTTNRHNDIALIRLKQNVPYTDFINPVCLPSILNLKESSTGSNLIVAGWGRTLKARTSSIKQKLSIPVFDHNDCAKRFLTKSVQLADSQLCAGGRFIEDSCDGDSGGPLMVQNKKNWAIEGIVSFGNRCGLENWPAIYTRVSSYEDWIKNKLRP